MSQLGVQIFVLVLLFGGMYMFLIRPQKKKEKQIQEMRNSIQVGDEIITIGGIYGKVVKTKDDSIVIQVGADKVKFEMARWSVSTVTSKSKSAQLRESEEEKEKKKKAMPKKLKKSDNEEVKEEAKEEVKETKED